MSIEKVMERVKELDEQIEKAIAEISRLKWEKTQLILDIANTNMLEDFKYEYK